MAVWLMNNHAILNVKKTLSHSITLDDIWQDKEVTITKLTKTQNFNYRQ